MGGDAELGDSDFLPAELEVKVVFMTKGRRWSCLPPLLWYSLVLCWLLHSASHWLDPDVKLTLNKLSSWALAAGWQIPTPTLLKNFKVEAAPPKYLSSVLSKCGNFCLHNRPDLGSTLPPFMKARAVPCSVWTGRPGVINQSSNGEAGHQEVGPSGALGGSWVWGWEPQSLPQIISTFLEGYVCLYIQIAIIRRCISMRLCFEVV